MKTASTISNRRDAKGRQEGGSHYKSMAIQPIDYIHRNALCWYGGNIVKYASRFKSKNGKEDLLKVIHYAEMAIEEYYD